MTHYPMIPAKDAPALEIAPTVTTPGYYLRRVDGEPLPRGMFARISDTTSDVGPRWLVKTQARSKYARRTETFSDLADAQALIMKWARRVIRERLAETTTTTTTTTTTRSN